MKKTYYEKVGRRYVPVYEYDSNIMDAYPKGAHLVVCQPGSTIRRYNVNPDYAPLIAAGIVAEDVISAAIVRASELRLNERLRKNPMSFEQKQAWSQLIEVFGNDASQLEWPSAREAADAGIKALIAEAEKLMQHPAVKQAYDHFLTVAALTKQQMKD